MTNREWLESLSDEELAWYIIKCYGKVNRDNECIFCNNKTRKDCKKIGCQIGIQNFLQAEHKDD